MKPLSLAWLLFAGLAVPLSGCVADSVATPKRDKRYIDPTKYYGTYVGKRLDKDSGDKEKPDSVLVLTKGDSTYTMTHNGVTFFGNYAYLSGEMELYVYEIDGMERGRVAELVSGGQSGAPGVTAEKLATYKEILDGPAWRFEVLPDGFKMKSASGKPAMYEFHRAPISGSGPDPAANGGGGIEGRTSGGGAFSPQAGRAVRPTGGGSALMPNR